MKLTPEEKKMLRGESGKPVKDALELQIEVGKFFGAKRLVPVSNVHMMGDIEVMGDSGKAFLERMSESGARCAVPTARCLHGTSTAPSCAARLILTTCRRNPRPSAISLACGPWRYSAT